MLASSERRRTTSALRPTTPASRRLAIALHGIEPATFERCAHIREWLAWRGVERLTLLVIPARDLHPVAERSPELVRWLAERTRAGDSIAQHGFQHSGERTGLVARAVPRTGWLRRDEEFTGLDARETRRAVNAGWRVLKLAGIQPRGFVAPGYAYTSTLREAVAQRFEWWSERLGVHRTGSPADAESNRPLHREPHMALPPRVSASAFMPPPLAPAVSSGRLRRSLSRALVRLEDLMPAIAIRLDVRPQDFDRDDAVDGLGLVLRRLTAGRRTITYDELALEAALFGPPKDRCVGDGPPRSPSPGGRQFSANAF
jgi:hypothetical protein